MINSAGGPLPVPGCHVCRDFSEGEVLMATSYCVVFKYMKCLLSTEGGIPSPVVLCTSYMPLQSDHARSQYTRATLHPSERLGSSSSQWLLMYVRLISQI